MSKKLKLGDRMKLYEKQYSGQKLFSLIPVCARIDGRAFHSFCKGLQRPYDERLSKLMQETTKFLIEETNARIGYTQSDEISLIWLQEKFENEIFFDSKLLKMTSVLASLATAFFNRKLPEYLPEKIKSMPVFDARVWNVPNETEAINYLIWRELDATRNSVSMAAQSMFSHKQLHGKNSKIMQDMMFESHNINWNDYPVFFKRGTYFQRKQVSRPFTSEELDKLHPKHDAKHNANLEVLRNEVVLLELPPIMKIQNTKAILFNGDDVVKWN